MKKLSFLGLLLLAACNLAQNLGGGSSSTHLGAGGATPGDGQGGAVLVTGGAGQGGAVLVTGGAGQGGAVLITGGAGQGGAVLDSCTDGVKDATETDVDCGGPVCPKCLLGQTCVAGSDCTSGSCQANVCH
jgi:hypothetical protein